MEIFKISREEMLVISLSYILVIAFSRKQIFGLKRVIERKTDLKAAIIYGALPPGIVL